jgi:predicted PurR-regulated permease PerM
MTPQGDAAAPEPSGSPPPWVGKAVRSGVWTLIGSVLAVLALLWFANQARELIRILIVSQFFALALEPGVIWLHEKRGWRRGSATGLILGATFVAFLLLILLMLPPLAHGVNGIVRSIPQWIDKLNAFTQEHFHTSAVSSSGRKGSAQGAANVSQYLKEHAGDLLGKAGGVIGAVFNIFTVGLFTFYLAANGPQVRRALLARMPQQRQERVLFAIDEAIRKMGGYIYANGILALINGGLLLVTLLIVGTPFALPIALSTGVIAEFIPIVGTYIAGVVPVVVTLASVGVGGTLVVIAELVVYQAFENYYLSPHISQRTMKLNAGIAFGAAMAGGAVGGFVGAFFALPIAAVVQSFLSTYSKRYEVTESALTKLPEPKPPKPPKPARERRRRRRAGVPPEDAAQADAPAAPVASEGLRPDA